MRVLRGLMLQDIAGVRPILLFYYEEQREEHAVNMDTNHSVWLQVSMFPFIVYVLLGSLGPPQTPHA